MATKPTLRRNSGGEWDLTIDPDNAPSLADAYECPEDPENSNIIGMYGLTEWGSWREAVTALIEFHRETCPNRREGASQAVYVVQSEEGDVVDVTTSRAWAEHLARDDEDNPARTIHEDTLWDGPADYEENRP